MRFIKGLNKPIQGYKKKGEQNNEGFTEIYKGE